MDGKSGMALPQVEVGRKGVVVGFMGPMGVVSQ